MYIMVIYTFIPVYYTNFYIHNVYNGNIHFYPRPVLTDETKKLINPSSPNG